MKLIGKKRILIGDTHFYFEKYLTKENNDTKVLVKSKIKKIKK
jgi:hypothetical protein